MAPGQPRSPSTLLPPAPAPASPAHGLLVPQGTKRFYILNILFVQIYLLPHPTVASSEKPSLLLSPSEAEFGAAFLGLRCTVSGTESYVSISSSICLPQWTLNCWTNERRVGLCEGNTVRLVRGRGCSCALGELVGMVFVLSQADSQGFPVPRGCKSTHHELL